ncbi:hypothetical protein [Anaerofustis stercorihominis]|uniref:hypothetical protein n=1 Tax=Anaerofustis stercorihominis TaxID=214853 RepID=UPI002673A3BB|nr:hypothetical protein [Anaerofustis stercorihominis]
MKPEDKKINELIEKTSQKTADHVIKNLRNKRIIVSENTLKKNVESLLRLYPYLEKNVQLKNKISSALDMINNTPYFRIIDLYYFKRKTVEETAEILETDVSNIYKKKRLLINNLKEILFADDLGEEIMQNSRFYK